jgi:CDP-glycerol glycerophosphotransferase
VPRISVVVPVYNVEPFLAECLESLAGQSFRDLEVVMVEDGSTDGSPAIAEAFAARDERFRLIRQPNGGLGKARNTGADAATGEFLAFVDSDDLLAANAYELLLGALDETGSDFATGNVHRLARRVFQAPYVAETFARTQLGTHVTRFRPLLKDRTAWNKLFRRAFWDANGFRFPEGVLNEDIPVILPAHFAANSVDVISEPIYFWRMREGEGSVSITQRRLEKRALHDRINAIDSVHDYLAEKGPRGADRWYAEAVVADDLRYHLNVLDAADEEYTTEFLDHVNAYLDRVSERVFDPLPAIERLKWHLVRRRLVPEVIEVLRFQRDGLADTPPVEIEGRWYGDYPFRGDSRLNVPLSVYLLDSELRCRVRVEDVRLQDDQLRIRGLAWIDGIGAASPDTQRISAVLVRPGRLQRLRLKSAALGLKTTAIRLKTTQVQRPDATAGSQQRLVDLTWSGFESTVELADLRRRGTWPTGEWRLYVVAEAGKVRRLRTTRFLPHPARPVRALDIPAAPDVDVRVGPAGIGGLGVEVASHWATVRESEIVDGKAIELSGDIRVPDGSAPKLEITRKGDGASRRYKLVIDRKTSPATFTARVPVAHVRAADSIESGEDEGESPEDDGDALADGGEEREAESEAADRDSEERRDDSEAADVWTVSLADGARRYSVRLPTGEEGRALATPAGGVSLSRNRGGDVSLVARGPAPRITRARWHEGGQLELGGELPAGHDAGALLLVSGSGGDGVAIPVEAGDGRFSVRFSPARIHSLAGELPLPVGTWELHMSAGGNGATLPVLVRHALYEQLPLAAVVDHQPFAFGMNGGAGAVLTVQRNLDDDERGLFHQRRLRATAYATRRQEPLRDAVVYSSFSGRQYSDNPRAIHEELVRRDAPLEHLWVVRDGMAVVPDSATLIREGSREFHEALARSRYVVANDHFPPWFARREDQTCLQTWHGTPLKRLGLDVSEMLQKVRRFERNWDQQMANWQYVLSPNRFATPILRRAYSIQGEMLETGYPRNDVLAAPDRDARSAAVRERLGIPAGVRTVLYAPTYRDNARDRRGRYRLNLHLDLARLRDAVGPDTVLLFRKHHYINEPVPSDPQGFVRDVSAYPDGTELMLAADVLVTDYSSSMFDFANTGRPMLFFTYDLERYRDDIRGFYFDFAATAPGPLLSHTDEVAEALEDLDGVRARYASRYDAFVASYCEFDDGASAARVVDRVFARDVSRRPAA